MATRIEDYYKEDEDSYKKRILIEDGENEDSGEDEENEESKDEEKIILSTMLKMIMLITMIMCVRT